MEEEQHRQQVFEMTTITNEQMEDAAEICALCPTETPVVAWKIGYYSHGEKFNLHYLRETRWLYICELCDGESRKLAPYWWNKALRGESLDDEEE